MTHFTFVILTVGKEMPNKYPSITPITAENKIRMPSFDLCALLKIEIEAICVNASKKHSFVARQKSNI